jgi:hypothetical protein
MREHGGPPGNQPLDQQHTRGDHGGDRRHTGQHAEPVRGEGHPRVQQRLSVDHQQHIPHHVHQGCHAEHQHADEQRDADRRWRGSCPGSDVGGGRRLLDPIGQTPARDHRIPRGGSKGPPSAPRWRWRPGTDRYPPKARRQPGPGALPGGGRSWRRRSTVLRAPLRVAWRHVRQGRHQRPTTAGAPLAAPVAHIPPSAALGAHLDHRTSVAPATVQAIGTRPATLGLRSQC